MPEDRRPRQEARQAGVPAGRREKSVSSGNESPGGVRNTHCLGFPLSFLFSIFVFFFPLSHGDDSVTTTWLKADSRSVPMAES